MRLLLHSSIPRHASLYRSFSASTNTTKPPLILWLGGDHRLLLPHSLLVPNRSKAQHVTLEDPTVSTIQELVEDHYSQVDDIGGMGESDQGVWFAGSAKDALLENQQIELIHESIQTIKEHRHGIPFGIYSSGRSNPLLDWNLVAATKCKLQISLFAGTPNEYAKTSGCESKDFGQVCGLIATAAEYVSIVEVGVLKEYAASAHSLALSLGAQEVVVYEQDDCIHAAMPRSD